MSFLGQLDEAIKAFRNKGDRVTDKQAMKERGEGYEDIAGGFGVNSLGSFNTFYSKYVNKNFQDEIQKIREYRKIAEFPEISDVIDDAVNESLQDDTEGYVLNFEVIDDTITKKEQVMKTLNEEFYDLFYNRLKVEENLDNWYEAYFTDGRVYLENVIDENNNKRGLLNVKKLPSETMDYYWNSKTGRIDFFIQYLKPNMKKPKDRSEAENEKDIIVFEPHQINFIPFKYGRSKNSVIGYLESCKTAYNILKLLETSLVIYRIVRAPERLVFKIDVGNMPRDKGMKFVEKVKQKMNNKQTFDPSTGTLVNANETLCIRQDTEIKLLDGRSLPLIDVIKEFNEGKENWVYSINQKTFNIEPGKIINAEITRKNEKLIRVHLDDESYHDVTYDHKFIMRDGTEKRADELKENDSLMPLYTMKKGIHSSKKHLDYEHYYDLNTNKYETTHKMVKENTERKRQKNEVVHHIDFNRWNNNPDNLMFMNFKEHFSYHGKHSKRLWENDYDKMLEAVRRGKQTLMNDPVAFENMKQKQRAKESRIEHWSKEKNKKIMSNKKSIDFDIKACELIIKAFIENGYPKRNDLFDILDENSEFIKYIKKLNAHKSPTSKFRSFNKNLLKKFYKLANIKNYDDLRERYQYNGHVINHKVSKIEYLEERDDTGCITVEGNHNFGISFNGETTVFIKNSILDNYFIPQSDNRGSDISTIGGNSSAFRELDDLYYFHKKLYRALKYPISRVEKHQEGQSDDVLFRGRSLGEITRDEIKWATFLEKHQKRWSNMLKNVFLLHLEFKGLKKQYGLNNDNLQIKFNPPSDYKEQMDQAIIEQRHRNYTELSREEEFSKYFLIKRYLQWDDDMIKENAEGHEKDKKFKLKPKEGEGGGW